MAELYLSKVVSTLPTPLEANALYLVKVGTGFRPYVTNSTGTIVSYGLNPIDWSELTGKPTLLAAANNLSDVAAPETARSNLGIDWEHIERRVITSSTAGAAFTNLSAFKRLRGAFRIVPVTNNSSFGLRFSTNNGASYDSTTGRHMWSSSTWIPGFGYFGRDRNSAGFGNEDTWFELTGNISSSAPGMWGTFELENFNQAAELNGNWEASGRRYSTSDVQLNRGAGWYTQTTARDAFIILGSSNIASATILLEGSRT